jgi:flagellar basal-body rod modification protein FlgD
MVNGVTLSNGTTKLDLGTYGTSTLDQIRQII